MEAVKGNTNAKIYGLQDDSAIVINGNSITTLGSSPYVINKE